MTQVEDPVRIVVPRVQALALANACTLEMDGHRWAEENVVAARAALGESGGVLLRALAQRLDRDLPGAPGWAVVVLSARLGDDQLQRAAAGVLAAVGRPFFSMRQGAGRLWIGEESTPAKDAASFGGTGEQGLHLDAPQVERVPEYTSLLVLRADPAGGGASLLGDVWAAAAALGEDDRAALREPVWFEGRAEGLFGVGEVRMPFPVLDEKSEGPGWVRWAVKMISDVRNAGRTGPLERFAAALDEHTVEVVLERGQLLIVDQRRMAHGRTALGRQEGLAEGTRRWIVQAKADYDPQAPAHRGLAAAGR